MAITFTKAVEVAPGDALTSAQYEKLAAAFNDRLRSGLGDPTFRIFYYLFGLFRQIRNPDINGQYPPMAEFFERFQMLPPSSTVEWPVDGPGDPEGANLSNVMNLFVFGNALGSVYSEEGRIGQMSRTIGVPAVAVGKTLQEYQTGRWYLGKLQRGLIDPVSGDYNAPAWDVAQGGSWMRTDIRGPHGNSRGGYLPMPPLDPEVSCPTIEGVTAPNFLYSFTALREGLENKSYPGSCYTPNGVDYMDHVHIGYTPWSYVVVANSGDVEVLSKKDYIEGPYDAPASLTNASGDQLMQATNAFVREFRGTDTQRSEPDYDNENAFDFQRFFTEQYWMAPARGVKVGDNLTSDPVSFYISEGDPSEYLTCSKGGTSYNRVSGFVMAGAAVNCFGMADPFTLEFLQGAVTVGSVTITPAGEDGYGEAIVKLDRAPEAADAFRVRLKSEYVPASENSIIAVETLELLDYRPELQDLYLVLRFGGANWDTEVDGIGTEESLAKEISDAYFANACICNLHGKSDVPGTVAAVNTNAVYDAARRMSQCIRVIPRANFLNYEVANGKTILYFKRRGLLDEIDLFEGIAPAREAITSGLIAGRKYVVSGTDVVYNGTTYHASDTFTGVFGKTTFTGSGVVHEYEGIRSSAGESDWTNEWLMGVSLKAGHDEETNIFKPDAYSDYFPFVNRCHLGSSAMAGGPALTWSNYGISDNDGVLSPETPSGYNYMLTPRSSGGNRANWRICSENDEECLEANLNFYKSCRIYEPDCEIESVTALVESGVEVVKIVFKTRFYHCPEAPASIARETGNWTDNPAEEPWRNWENGLREYLLGPPCEAGMAGNTALNSTITSNHDQGGSCYPHFFFTRLIPNPYHDDNDTAEVGDCRVTHDQFSMMELYLRAMCEGYVDGAITGDKVCQMMDQIGTTGNAVYDYSFPNLCFDAFGNRNLGVIGSVATDYVKASDVREDYAWGHGPLPNTYMMAEVFNRFVKAINKLDQVRLMLPMEIQYRYADNQAFASVPPSQCYVSGSGYGGVCGTTHSYLEAVPPVPETGTFQDDWSAVNSCTAHLITAINGLSAGETAGALCYVGNDNWTVVTTRRSIQLRAEPIDSQSLYACPETWRDMVDGHAVVYAQADTYKQRFSVRRVATGVDNESCTKLNHTGDTSYSYWPDGEGYCLEFYESTNSTETECITLQTGTTYDAPPIECDAVNDSCIFPYNTHPAGEGNAALALLGHQTHSITITPLLVDSVLKIPLA